MQMTRSIVQPGAPAAHELIEIDMLGPPRAPAALEIRPPLLVPHHQHGVPVDQNIWCVSGEQAPPVTTTREPSDRPFHERTDAVELEGVDALPVLDQTSGWEMGWVRIAE